MGISLVLLAYPTAFDIFTHVGGQARPPEFSCDELAGFQIAGVTGSFMVVTTLEDGVAEGVVIGDVDTALVG